MLIDLLMFAPSVGGRGSENLAPIAIAHLWALQIPRWGCLKHICDGIALLCFDLSILLTFNVHLLRVLYEDRPANQNEVQSTHEAHQIKNQRKDLQGALLKIHSGFSLLTPGGNWLPSVPFRMLQVLFPPVLPSTSA